MREGRTRDRDDEEQGSKRIEREERGVEKGRGRQGERENTREYQVIRG